MIYRGFDIVKDDKGSINSLRHSFDIFEKGEQVHTATSEDAAMTWVDAEKRKRAASK